MRKYKPVLFFCTFVVILGLLRYSPWNAVESDSVVQSRKLITDTTFDLGVGYLPVTCHLTCPVTDFASKTTESKTIFNSIRFSDFPTVVNALETKQIQAAFLTVPLAFRLREQGVPIKVCYLGHRDGSEVIVAKNSKVRGLKDLTGRRFGIPSYFSNQNLVINKMMVDQGMDSRDIDFVVLPPPDMPTALASGAVDGYFVGEPFCAKAELENIGRVLYYSRDIWPNFISCALVVHEDLIRNKPEVVKDLVRGIAQSGKWAEDNRSDAAKLMAVYSNQDPKLINFVLTSSERRVSYLGLTPTEAEFKQIMQTMVKVGLLKSFMDVKTLLDLTYIPKEITRINIDMNAKPKSGL